MMGRGLSACLVLFVCIQTISAQTLGLGKSNLQNFNGHNRMFGVESLEASEETTTHFYHGAVIDNFAQVDKLKPWHSGQRYFKNDKFWKGPGAPIFLFIGGEGAEVARRLGNHTYMYTLAEEHGALMLDLEHRFYGESAPFADTATENLAYLTSEQALADLSRFITFFKESTSSQASPVIAFGGSYPGNLAAWVRLKYPHLITGSIASSAPVNAKTEFGEYNQVVGDSLRFWGGDACYNTMERATAEVADRLNKGEFKQLEADMKICTPLQGASKDDLMVLQSNLMGNVQGTVQYNGQGSAATVSDVCSILGDAKTGDEAYAAFVRLNAMYLKELGQKCVEASYSEMLGELKDASWASESRAARMWTYQTCNEFGYYQTTSMKGQPFSAFALLDLKSSLKICADVYGMKQEPEVGWTNAQYGGSNVHDEEVVFVEGSLDPWHALGVNKDTKLPAADQSAVALAGSHCQDMSNAEPYSDSMKGVRAQVAAAVKTWVNGQSLASLHH